MGLLGATLGWELAHRLALTGGMGIDITSALRPETHKFLTSSQLALVQSNLGLTLRDVYLQLMFLGLGCLACAFWLPDKDADALAFVNPRARNAGRRTAGRCRLGVLSV